MGHKLPQAFSECLASIKRGEAPDACLARYPQLRQQLKPLLVTALSVSAVPRALPSNDFRRQAKSRLLARMTEKSQKQSLGQIISGLASTLL